MAIGAKKFVNGDRGSENEASDVHQDERMTWLKPRVHDEWPLPTEEAGGDMLMDDD